MRKFTVTYSFALIYTKTIEVYETSLYAAVCMASRIIKKEHGYPACVIQGVEGYDKSKVDHIKGLFW